MVVVGNITSGARVIVSGVQFLLDVAAVMATDLPCSLGQHAIAFSVLQTLPRATLHIDGCNVSGLVVQSGVAIIGPTNLFMHSGSLFQVVRTTIRAVNGQQACTQVACSTGIAMNFTTLVMQNATIEILGCRIAAGAARDWNVLHRDLVGKPATPQSDTGTRLSTQKQVTGIVFLSGVRCPLFCCSRRR